MVITTGEICSLDHQQANKIKLCFELLALASAINCDCVTLLGRYQLSEDKFLIFCILNDIEQHSLFFHALVNTLSLTRATIAGLLDGMERDGFIIAENHAISNGRKLG